jgi:hypothetical protein
MKLDLLTNATVVDDAIRFVFQKSNEKLKLSSDNSNQDDKEESNDPDYDEDKDQLATSDLTGSDGVILLSADCIS